VLPLPLLLLLLLLLLLRRCLMMLLFATQLLSSALYVTAVGSTPSHYGPAENGFKCQAGDM